MKGTGLIVDKNDVSEEFEFEGPIDLFRISFHLADTPSKNGTLVKTIQFKDYIFEFDTSKITIKTSESKKALSTADLKTWLKEAFIESVKKFKDETVYSDPAVMFKLPVTSIAPLFGVYYLAMMADDVLFNEKFIEF